MLNEQNFALMKIVELLKLGGETLKLMSENDVKRDYYRFVPMYYEFLNMRRNGVKYREAVRMLADSYRSSKATVARVVRKLGEEC